MLTRRGFLARGAAAGLGVAGAGAMLAALGDQATQGGGSGGPVPIPSPNRPVSWPLPAGNPPIPGGLRPERKATLKVLNWPDYVSTRCLDDFGRAHRCQVEVTTFGTMSQATASLASPAADYDVVIGTTIDALGPLITRQLIQPLNHSYLHNAGQVWPDFLNPFYDQGSRYTVPYTAFTTGIAWRKDLVPENPYALTNGWTFLWQPKYRGKIGILDNYRESVSLGLLSTGFFDLNSADPRQLNQASQALLGLGSATSVIIDNEPDRLLADGTAWIHHIRSGDVAAAARVLPAGVLGYWFPPDGIGPVGNDTLTVPRRAGNPVLAHHFLNFLLDRPNAQTNVTGTGFAQPLRWLTPDRLVRLGVLPAGLLSAAVQPSNLWRGLRELPLPEPADQLWQHSWRSALPAARQAR